MENELYKKLVELLYNNLYAKIILSALERDIFSNLEDEKQVVNYLKNYYWI